VRVCLTGIQGRRSCWLARDFSAWNAQEKVGRDDRDSQLVKRPAIKRMPNASIENSEPNPARPWHRYGIESSDSRHVQEPADTLGSWRQTSNSVHSNCLLACVAGLNNLHLLWRNVIFQLHGTMAGKKQHGFSVVGSTLRSE
jgi:hypothetical protein